MNAVMDFFRDNAMFYKDLTQWLRNKTFVAMFFGLLLVAETISLIAISNTDATTASGSFMFYALLVVLVIYGILIAFLGHSMTKREFANKTFELYELSGMSLERMVGGKFLSMAYQFLFGFFCLVPFMFFAYFLGGLDFLELVVGIFLVCVIALPGYLAVLAAAVSNRFRQASGFIKLISIFFLFIFLFYFLVGFFWGATFMQSAIRELSDWLKDLALDPVTNILRALFVVGLYVQVCLFFFYYSCDVISRETDSREIPLKIVTFTMVVSWMGMYMFLNWGGYGAAGVMAFLPVFIALLILGLRSCYAGARAPAVVTRRNTTKGPVRRMLYQILKPGVQGGVRTLFVIIFVVLVMANMTPISTNGWISGMTLIAQIPWFLAFPVGLIYGTKSYSGNYVSQRSLAILFWVVAGILIGLLQGRSSYAYRYSDAPDVLVTILAVVLSPLSSYAMAGSDNDMVFNIATLTRICTGLLGTFMLWRMSRYVIAQDAKLNAALELANGDAEPAPLTADAPPPAAEDNA